MHDNYAFLAFQTEVLARWFSQSIDQPVSILDYGCGDGVMAHFVSNSFFKAQVYATDLSTKTLEKVREDFEQIRCIEYANMHTYKGFFDLVYVSCVMHHVDFQDRAAIIDKLLALLKPEGRLVIFELNPLNAEVKHEFDKNPAEKYASMLYPWDLYRIIRMAASSCAVRFCSQGPAFLERFMVVAPLYALIAAPKSYSYEDEKKEKPLNSILKLLLSGIESKKSD